MSLMKKFNIIADKNIYNLRNSQLLLNALEELIYKYIDALNKKAKLTNRDAEQIHKLYSALASREKHIIDSLQQLFKLILELNSRDLSEFQVQELQQLLQKYESINIYIDKGELTDPKKFTEERSQILDNLDSDALTD